MRNPASAATEEGYEVTKLTKRSRLNTLGKNALAGTKSSRERGPAMVYCMVNRADGA